MTYRELLDISLANRVNSYAPYSKVRVSAALLCDDGEVFKGVNVENASYGGTICAERSAIVSAVSSGKKKFKAIAISSNLDELISPCGICRQFIHEFGRDIDVILGNEEEYKVYKISELLPLGFELNE